MNSMVTTDARFPTVNFIGNKQKIAAWILDNTPGGGTFFDAFSGGGSVGFEAKRRGYRVLANDIMGINHMMGKALIENRNVTLGADDAEGVFSTEPREGFMFRTYANIAFHPRECMELDGYRAGIGEMADPYKRALAFALLRRAMIRKMPYSRFTIPWKTVKRLRDESFSYERYGRKRAYHNRPFREHFMESVREYNGAVFDNGRDNMAYNANVFDLLHQVKADVIYLDPPYVGTMNDYHGFYGIMDDYIRCEKTPPFPDSFTDRGSSTAFFDRMFGALRNCSHMMLSHNNSSYPGKGEMLRMMKRHASGVDVTSRRHNYQVSGSARKSSNMEYLFIMHGDQQ